MEKGHGALCAILGLDASQSEEKYRITELQDFGRSWEILGEVGRFWEKLGDFGRSWEKLGDGSQTLLSWPIQ
jgi:hypothetical protein